MKFTYTPEGSDQPRSWDYRPGKLLNVEAEKIEDLTGWSYIEFGQALMNQSMKAYHALLYIFLKRSDPTLKYDQVVFSFDEVDIDYSEEEMDRIIEALQRERAEQGLTPETENVLNALLAERAGREPEPAPEEEVDPKASQGFAQPGDGSSPTSSTSVPATSTNSPSSN